MKFSLKVVMGTMLIVVIMFSLFGIILIHENFKNSYQLQMKINYNEHILEKYSIESNLNENVLADGTLDLEKLESYLYSLTFYLSNSRKLAVFIDNVSVWNNVPFELKIDECDDVCTKMYDSKKYSVLKSRVSINKADILIISVYDISGVFEVRNQNLLKFYVIDVFLLLLCGCFTTLFARFLTKPIRDLNRTTKLVSEGNFDVKIDVKGNDEIGELSNAFDLMVKSVKKREDELKLSLKQREDFISNFTHELKTPMTSIIGFVKALKQDKYSDEDKEKALDYIYSETKRLDILSHKLLDLIGLSENQVDMSILDTSILFQEVKSLAFNRFPDIVLNLDVQKQNVFGDKELLVVCIMNLIENAYKASEESKDIKIVGKNLSDRYQISIIDKGIGIEKKEIKRIVEDFYMVDRSRSKKKGSYGLGLGLCSKILKLHNSELSFKSKVGKGTLVRFVLEVKNEE